MKKTKAFTLVELLIVIAIIAVLATIGVVTYSSQKQNAANATVKSNLADAVASTSACTADGVGTVNAPTVTTAAPTGGNSICSVSTTVNAIWPNLAATDSTMFYQRGWAATAPIPVCASSSTQICIAAIVPPVSGNTTITGTTKSAICTIPGSCTYYGTGW